jgi:hypothetical protein
MKGRRHRLSLPAGKPRGRSAWREAMSGQRLPGPKGLGAHRASALNRVLQTLSCKGSEDPL